MGRRKGTEPVAMSINEMLLEVARRVEQQAVKPNIYGYDPHDKQKWFHKLVCSYRKTLYIGGNRSGKSYGSVAEDIRWMLKLSPVAKRYKEPIRGRVIAVDFDRGVLQILHPIFKILTPPDKLRGGSWEEAYDKKERILNFADGGTIQFMSYEQSTEKFAGTSLHFVHYDEEPPKNIWDENQARLVDTTGHAWISMTPVEGMTWLYDRIYAPADDSDNKTTFLEGSDAVGPVWASEWDNGGFKDRLAVIEVDMDENPHLSAEAREEFLAGLDPDDRVARRKGQFVQRAGKVFGIFQEDTHVLRQDFDPKKAQINGWQIYTSTDHGWNNPSAWLWHAVSPSGRVVTFAEHYESHMTIAEHAAIVKGKEAGWGLDVDRIIRTGDPAMHQKSAITGTSVIMEYAKEGNDLFIYTDSVPKDPSIGIGRMQQYFRLRDGDGEAKQPTWVIAEACNNFIGELKKLRWATYSSPKIRYDNNPQEKVHKKDDHAFDSAKYFATFLDDLAPEAVAPPGPGVPTDILRYDVALAQQLEDSRRNAEAMQWTIVETFN